MNIPTPALKVVFALAALATPGLARAQASRPASRPASTTPVGPEAVQAQLTLIFEVESKQLRVQEMWQLRNGGAGPVPAAALVFDLGEDVQGGVNLDEETLKTFAIEEGGRQVRARQDLPAGGTTSFAGNYRIALDGGDARMARTFPVPVLGGRVIFKELPGLEVSGSTSFSPRLRDFDGLTFRVFDFGGLPAGHRFELDVSGVPSHVAARRARDIAVVLSLAAFAWMIFQVARRRPQMARARVLGALSPQARRDQLLRALELLEEDRLAGRIEGAKHDRRRKALMVELADILREIELSRGAGSRGA